MVRHLGRVFLSLTVLAVSGGAGGFVAARLAQPNQSGVAQAASPEPVPSPLLKQTSESFRAVAKRVGPAVVVVKSGGPSASPAMARRGRPQPEGPVAPDENMPPGFGFPQDPLWDLFRGYGLEPQPGGPQREPRGGGLGSGFIVDKRGYIVTNNHVVAEATTVSVVLSDDDSEEHPATIVGRDPRTDLAVIKITPKGDLPVAEWGDSTALEVGDWAVAIGSPFMLSHSVTAGIVSAKGRNANELMGSDYGFDMIQTDAAINPGNSGGPLCALDGKVIGVNTAIYSHSGGYMGIGFAIPASLAKDITRQLIESGKITRGWLGIAIRKADPPLLQELNLKHGLVVQEVRPGGPAASGGLNPGDVILSVSGVAVQSTSDLQKAIAARKPGEKITLRIVPRHDSRQRDKDFRLGEAPSGAPRPNARG